MIIPNVDLKTADANGRINALGSGKKFLVQPAGLTPGSPVGLTALVGYKQSPFDFFAGGGLLELDEEFTELAITGCTPGGTYLCGTFPRGAGYKATGNTSRQTATLGVLTFLGSFPGIGTTPAGSIQLYGSWLGWNAYLKETPGHGAIVYLLVKSLSGAWYNTGPVVGSGAPNQFDANGTAVVFGQTQFPGGIMAFLTTDPTVTGSIDIVYEVQG